MVGVGFKSNAKMVQWLWIGCWCSEGLHTDLVVVGMRNNTGFGRRWRCTVVLEDEGGVAN